MMIMRPKKSTICVVDPVPDDYSSLLSSAPKQEARLRFLTNGRAALRVDSHQEPELWIINLSLPDMSGVDLFSMIRSRFPSVPIYLVGDRYSAQEEIQARSSGATMYFCKPLRSEWLLSSGAHVRSQAS